MKRSAFTMIELLVVIAIIGILAAIIFPVFAKARKEAYKSSDMTDLNEIRNALQLYRADQGGYPPVLLGYVTLYTSGPNMGQVVPANAIHGPLLPRRITFEALKPALNRFGPLDRTFAVWPEQDARAVGTAPILDLNGDGSVDNNDDTPGARQAFGPDTRVQRPDPVNQGQFIDAEFYPVSGYDVERVRQGSGFRIELRYALFWTAWGLTSGNAFDDPRQLGYADPPESTVVTWDGMFRDYAGPGDQPLTARLDVVLFLGGSAKSFDSRMMYDRSWRVLP